MGLRQRREDAVTDTPFGLDVSDSRDADTFEVIFKALHATSQPWAGPLLQQLVVIPIRDDAGSVAGGFWGSTLFQWLQVEMLFVPQPLRGLGVGSALMAMAERTARDRGCRGAYVDTFSFQAVPFYEKLGFTVFGVLDDFPPGHSRIYLRKRFDALPT